MTGPAITGATKVAALLDEHPFLVDVLAAFNAKFGLLRNKIARNTMGRVATLEMVAKTGGVPLDELLKVIALAIRDHTGELPEVAAADEKTSRERIEKLKAIVLELHAGAPYQALKKRFDETIQGLAESEIARMEEELIRGGLPVSEVQKLCDLHVGLVKGELDKKEGPRVPPGHPVHTYMEDNRIIALLAGEIESLVGKIAGDESRFGRLKEALNQKLGAIAKIDIHYKRKENQLFPYLERHEITGPSKVMWGVHDEIRATMRKLKEKAAAGDAKGAVEEGRKFAQAVNDMIYKEEHILFPMCLEALTPEEWVEIAAGEKEIGFAFAEPAAAWPGDAPVTETAPAAKTPAPSGTIALDTGALSAEQVNLLLKHLPVEASFVDENDQVRYYTDVKDRMFPRSPGVIGRKVQDCHPQKSLPVVQRILDAFRAGEKDTADFWIALEGKFILIRYVAVRDGSGKYRGTVEVTQDVTGIRKLEGQRRLLDWE